LVVDLKGKKASMEEISAMDERKKRLSLVRDTATIA
jgi:hypothetical protein